MDKSSLAEKLIQIRKSFGLTQNEFAKRLGVSTRGYKNYEWAVREIPLSVVYRIFTEFKINPNWLFFSNGQMEMKEHGELLEDAMYVVKLFINQNDLVLPIEKEVKLVKYIFERMVEDANFSSEDIKKYLLSAI